MTLSKFTNRCAECQAKGSKLSRLHGGKQTEFPVQGIFFDALSDEFGLVLCFGAHFGLGQRQNLPVAHDDSPANYHGLHFFSGAGID
jgi:hypothetical protein